LILVREKRPQGKHRKMPHKCALKENLKLWL